MMRSLKLTAFFPDWNETVKKNATESNPLSSSTTKIWCNMLIGNLTSATPGKPVGTGDNSADPPASDAANFADVVASGPSEGADADNASRGAAANHDAQADADSAPETPPDSQGDASTPAQQSDPSQGISEMLAPFSVTQTATQADDLTPGQQMRLDTLPSHTSGQGAAGSGPNVPGNQAATTKAPDQADAMPGTQPPGRTNARFSSANEIGQAGPASGSMQEGRSTILANAAGGQIASLMGLATGSANSTRTAGVPNTSPAPEVGKTGQTASEGPPAGVPPVALRQIPAPQATTGLNSMATNQPDSALPALVESMSADGAQLSRLFSHSRDDLFPIQTRLEATGLGIEAARDAPKPGQAEIARAVASQINDVLLRRGDGSFEIALNPEELGRVRVAMKPGDGIMTLMIAAERPETLDLMRRHIDQLASEFRELGYSAVHVDLSGADDGDRQPDHGTEPGADIAQDGDMDAPELAATAHPALSRGSSTGLDLRL
ncbi:flagellar hook-length control protein FliK [Ruegeria sp. 2012CJ41-6]|uniref:Flagellar hook-length control protein FliK n=1 Tax=Ruegeria spongiae TaxID=2942209 RepID=A0ABT0Q4A6_9RHOB|nr:flagellar hook-length control protein FliK [Ruegeria spongiae]MCL6284676.1 flagellar hook-length control protein FliK [Ruegeria spongiae]